MAECRSRVPTGGESERFGKTTLANMEAHVLTLDFDSSRTQYGFDKRIYLV